MVSVPDAPDIVLPARPTLEEDGMLAIHGVGMYDGDVSGTDDENLLFDVWLETASGRLTLNESRVRLCIPAYPCRRCYHACRVHQCVLILSASMGYPPYMLRVNE